MNRSQRTNHSIAVHTGRPINTPTGSLSGMCVSWRMYWQLWEAGGIERYRPPAPRAIRS